MPALIHPVGSPSIEESFPASDIALPLPYNFTANGIDFPKGISIAPPIVVPRPPPNNPAPTCAEIWIGVFVGKKGKSFNPILNVPLNTEEWYCPECGFHIQAGDKCIYCDTEKPA